MNILEIVKLTTIFLSLIPLSIIDIKKRLVPNLILIALLIIYFSLFLSSLLLGQLNIHDQIASFAITFIVFIFFVTFSFLKISGFGMGDVKLIVVLCLYLTPIVSFVGCIIAFTILLIVSSIMILQKKWNKATTVALVPYLSVGHIISFLIFTMLR